MSPFQALFYRSVVLLMVTHLLLARENKSPYISAEPSDDLVIENFEQCSSGSRSWLAPLPPCYTPSSTCLLAHVPPYGTWLLSSSSSSKPSTTKYHSYYSECPQPQKLSAHSPQLRRRGAYDSARAHLRREFSQKNGELLFLHRADPGQRDGIRTKHALHTRVGQDNRATRQHLLQPHRIRLIGQLPLQLQVLEDQPRECHPESASCYIGGHSYWLVGPDFYHSGQ